MPTDNKEVIEAAQKILSSLAERSKDFEDRSKEL